MNRFQQLVRSNAKAGGFFRAEMGQEPVIWLYTFIGKDYDWETGEPVGMTDMDFIAALTECRNAPVVHLRVNSPGGDVFMAKAMQTAMMQYHGRIIAHVDSLAASAAASLVMYADEVEMSSNAFLMIHKAWTISAGNADDLMKVAATLEQMDDSIAQDYCRKTGMKKDEVLSMMAETTYLNAETAMEKKFCDRIIEPETKVTNQFDLSVYGYVPDALKISARVKPDAQNEPIKYDHEAIQRRLNCLERIAV